jgi:hypothetical protein
MPGEAEHTTAGGDPGRTTSRALHLDTRALPCSPTDGTTATGWQEGFVTETSTKINGAAPIGTSSRDSDGNPDGYASGLVDVEAAGRFEGGEASLAVRVYQMAIVASWPAMWC